MADQLDMFAAPAPPPVCPHHDERHVCVECLPGACTDGLGFIHRIDAKGKLPLRRCEGCKRLRTPGHWNHRDYFHCVECVPLGSTKK